MTSRHAGRAVKLAAPVLVLGFLAGTPAAVSACVTAGPTFVEAVHGARAIARVTIVEGWDGAIVGDASETFRVDRVLKGTLPALVTLDPATTSICGDSISSLAGAETSEGETIVVAFDVPFSGQTIHPLWADDLGLRVTGTAESPAGIRTLAELEAAILAELALPNTATVQPAPVATHPVTLVVAAAAAAFAIRLRTLRPVLRSRGR